MNAPGALEVDFLGELHHLDGTRAFAIGREGDLVVDDNPYLHRRFLELRTDHGLWWLSNVGGKLAANVSDPSGGVHAWLPSGGQMPIVFPSTIVRFTAGPTEYELVLHLSSAPYSPVDTATGEHASLTATFGRVTLTTDQKLMLLVLAEPALRRGAPGMAAIPTSGVAAARLGWTLKAFEKKIDNVCEKFSRVGVKGLKGGVGNLALSRRSRLVEHVLAARVLVVDDLRLLDQLAVGVDPTESGAS